MPPRFDKDGGQSTPGSGPGQSLHGDNICHGLRADLGFSPEMVRAIVIDAVATAGESRDPKGLYNRARAGEIPEFAGICARCEPPVSPELRAVTATPSVDDALAVPVVCVNRNFALTKA